MGTQQQAGKMEIERMGGGLMGEEGSGRGSGGEREREGDGVGE